jgi:hypothetical protein
MFRLFMGLRNFCIGKCQDLSSTDFSLIIGFRLCIDFIDFDEFIGIRIEIQVCRLVIILLFV